MNTEETVLIVGAVVIALFVFSKSKGGSGQTLQTSPFANNPNKGINSTKQNTTKGGEVLDYLNTGLGVVNKIGQGVTGNDSFNALDAFGNLTGGWGSKEDVSAMTLN